MNGTVTLTRPESGQYLTKGKRGSKQHTEYRKAEVCEHRDTEVSGAL